MANFLEMEEAFKKFVNNLPQFFWLADKNGKIFWFSQSWHDYTGITAEEIAIKGWQGVAHPSQLKEVVRSFRKSIENQTPWEKCFLMKSSKGSMNWYLTNAIPLYNNKKQIQRWIGMNTDITKLKNTEDELLKSETRYKLATQATQDIIYDWDLLTNEITWNEAIATKLNYTEVPKGTDIGWWKERIHPVEREEVLCDLLHVLNSSNGTWRKNYRFLKGDGEYAYILERGHIVRDENGKAVRMIGAMTDITAERTAVNNLNRAKNMAEQANEAKSRFLASMSHEVRTPLSAMLGFIELLKDEKVDKEDKRNFLEIINRNGQQLLRIIDDVLDLSRVESGKFSVENVEVILDELLLEVRNLMELSARNKGLVFTTKKGKAVPNKVFTDPGRLKQIILNMVGNSIKFTNEGAVEVELLYQDSYLLVRVTDTGIGIKPEQQTKIFEPFKQADDSTAKLFGGTGLGLSLTQKISQAMGGDFYLKFSEAGKGSCFEAKVFAPLSKEDFEQESAEERGMLDLTGCRVLVVDDAEDNRILLSELLKPKGAIVNLAESGVEALRLVVENKYDVILLDIQMSKMDGYEVVETLQRLGVKIPIIALTAHAMSEERDRALSHGFDAFVTKPVDSKKLYKTIAELRKKLRQSQVKEHRSELGVHDGTPLH